MDLQLHDGYSAAPRRVFTNTRQLLRSAYGTPTYFQFLNESGMDESYDDETLEAGFFDFLQNAKTFGQTVGGQKGQFELTKQQLIDTGKQAGQQALQVVTTPGSNKAEGLIRTGMSAVTSLIPGGSFIMPAVEGIANILGGGSKKSFPDINTQEGAQQTLQKIANMNSLPFLEKTYYQAISKQPAIMQRIQSIASQSSLPSQPAPVVAALPTGFPIVGKTAAGLAPEAGLPPAPKTGTFAGMDLKTLALLGIGGFLAYKFLTKK